MKFGEAITLLNAGRPVTRAGWNGKGMFLIRAGGYKVNADDVKPNGIINAEFLKRRGLTQLEILPHIDMWTVNAHGRQAYLPGWLASQSDMLADDWMEYSESEYQPMTTAVLLDEAQKQFTEQLRKHTEKKLHWTQTPRGKEIMANRKPRGSKK
jgi:hypothetical protein